MAFWDFSAPYKSRLHQEPIGWVDIGRGPSTALLGAFPLKNLSKVSGEENSHRALPKKASELRLVSRDSALAVQNGPPQPSLHEDNGILRKPLLRNKSP